MMSGAEKIHNGATESCKRKHTLNQNSGCVFTSIKTVDSRYKDTTEFAVTLQYLNYIYLYHARLITVILQQNVFSNRHIRHWSW